MFEKRLRWFVVLMVALALVTVARLVDIQVVRADHFAALADDLLTRKPRYLAAPRGSILDRNGRVLVSDEPTSDVSVRYEVLAALLDDTLPTASRKYLEAVARLLRKRGSYPDDMATRAIVADLEARLDAMWERLAELTGASRSDLQERAGEIRRRVERIKEVVQRDSPTVRAIAEEEIYHSLVADIDERLALEVRLELEAEYPWLRVVPGSRRVAHDADVLVHVLGRLGAADPRSIEEDPLRDDELRSLWSGATRGITGIERVAELTLRGTRGRIVEDFDRKTEREHVDPVRGRNATLTIDTDLQRRTLEILKQAVDKSENPAGGSAVIIDVASREVLALVSYPVYAYDDYGERYAKLARDNRWQPLRFRAVANMYPPGSTCKVIALYGGLADGLITADSRITCTGYLRPDHPSQFRCWIYKQYGITHESQRTEDAIRNSCNIFLYTVGGRLGVDRLCHWFSEFGLGRLQGTGLIEESLGIVPTSQWIEATRTAEPRVQPADAWNYSIGQGEVSATPLQCANVAATIAAGRWEPVKLCRDADGNWLGADRAEPVAFDERHLRVLRAGMWRVVNESGATAYKHARLDSDRYVLCGKTGSAQAAPRPISRRWFLEWSDGRREQVIGEPDERMFLARYADEKPKIRGYRTYERFPALAVDESLPAHAWFIAYTQTKDTVPGTAPRGRCYAISVIVEYAGSGGRDAGPVAKAIAELLVGE